MQALEPLRMSWHELTVKGEERQDLWQVKYFKNKTKQFLRGFLYSGYKPCDQEIQCSILPFLN